MSKLILQPCADPLAIKHFESTVVQEVDLKLVKMHLPHMIKDLKKIYPTGKCKIWGVVSRKGRNANKWARIEPGDKVFFAKHKLIFASGTVTMTIQSKELATDLWRKDDKGNTWEYIYFLSNLQDQKISYKTFNAAIGYSPQSNIQSFQVLDLARSLQVLDRLDFESDNFSYLPLSKKSLEQKKRMLRALMGSTNKKYLANGRMEQVLLQEILFAGKEQDFCGICQKIFPVSLLVVAHIKKRACCSEEDRVNENVVMPMCKMGCDELFERGYISVREGKIVAMPQTTTRAVKDYISTIEGKKCKYHNDETMPFFEWHYEHHSKPSFTKRHKKK